MLILFTNFNTFIKYITIVLISLILVFIIYLVLLKIKVNSKWIKEKKIIGLVQFIDSRALNRLIIFLNYLIYVFFIILAICSLYMYFNFNFSLTLANDLNSLVNNHYNFKGEFKVLFSIGKNNGKLVFIEDFHNSIGVLGMIILNFYRTLYILHVSFFPIFFKLILGSLLTLTIKICSYYIINLFNTESEFFSEKGYTFQTLFYQYNFSLYFMFITIILGIIFIIIEYYLNIHIKHLDKYKESINKLMLDTTLTNNNSYFYLFKIYFFNFKICLFYYKWNILLIIIKVILIINIFAYFNCLLFLCLHSMPDILIKLINK